MISDPKGPSNASWFIQDSHGVKAKSTWSLWQAPSVLDKYKRVLLGDTHKGCHSRRSTERMASVLFSLSRRDQDCGVDKVSDSEGSDTLRVFLSAYKSLGKQLQKKTDPSRTNKTAKTTDLLGI